MAKIGVQIKGLGQNRGPNQGFGSKLGVENGDLGQNRSKFGSEWPKSGSKSRVWGLNPGKRGKSPVFGGNRVLFGQNRGVRQGFGVNSWFGTLEWG